MVHDIAYRGYIITHNPFTGQCWIEKSGWFIGTAKDDTDAKRIIDALLAE